MTTYRLRDNDLTWMEVQGELVALDADASTYLSANDSGLTLWQALADGATREQLVAVLLDAYDVDEARAGADVDAFLADLRERGLVES